MLSRTRAGLTVCGALVALTLAGCTSAPAGPVVASPSPGGSGAPTLTIAITINGGKVTPNGEKIDASVGQQVVLDVTSDTADEIHAHTGGDGYELEVPAGKPTTGTFTLTSPGSFEVESHHLEKVIVILNAR